MDEGAPRSLFVNDGSFMERFKQLQGDREKNPVKDKAVSEKDSNPKPVVSVKPVIGRTGFQLKTNSKIGSSASASGGKLAFSLKQKSKLVAPPVLGGDDEDDDGADAGNVSGDGSYAKRQKLGLPYASENKSHQADVAPPSPIDPTVKNIADRLANFVAKNGRQFENVTRQKNPGDTPFKFLFDKMCSDYKYYEYQLSEAEKALSQTRESQNSSNVATSTSTSKSTGNSQRSRQLQPNYQTPASALYEAVDDTGATTTASAGEISAPSSADSLAMMEFYMKKAAQEERKKPFKQSNDEMPPPPPPLQASSKRGHHMGDYIPQEELEKFMASCNDASAQKSAKETAEKVKIQADNVGHKLLSKMGWREGEGLGSSRSGIADPITTGNIKQDHLGVGAQQPGEVSSEDDIYEQYKKRMMLGYRYRPNPLNNPRKAYY